MSGVACEDGRPGGEQSRAAGSGIREGLIFGCRALRIACTTGLPMMVLDAHNDWIDLGFWKTAFG